MSLSRNIKQVMALLNKAIAQTPLDKQPLLTHKVHRVVQKYSKLDPEQNQAPYLRELQFNLNFIRLSFPHLDYSPPAELKQEKAQDQDQQNMEQRVKEEFFQLENKEQVQKFMEETEKTLRGVREEVQFSNWGTGNLDPEDLKRHKELLKRQHFGGQFWKDKEKPMSPTASFLLNMMEQEPQKRTQKINIESTEPETFSGEDLADRWEKVKR